MRGRRFLAYGLDVVSVITAIPTYLKLGALEVIVCVVHLASVTILTM